MTTQQTTWTEYTGSDEQIAEMQIRQAMTKQPTWIKIPTVAERFDTGARTDLYYRYECTTNPNWGIPNAEYSFTSFED